MGKNWQTCMVNKNHSPNLPAICSFLESILAKNAAYLPIFHLVSQASRFYGGVNKTRETIFHHPNGLD